MHHHTHDPKLVRAVGIEPTTSRLRAECYCRTELRSHGRAGRDRTSDLSLMRALLCRLSYGATNLAGAPGFEPRSSVLETDSLASCSYAPECQNQMKTPA
jgi:hypothetical protein